MAWYHQPIRPLDPVIPDDQVTQATRYVRDDFSNSGQDSFTRPPAQDAAMWQQAKNIMPITRSAILRRWGYNVFAAPNVSTGIQRLFQFQSDASNQRNIVWTSPTQIQAFNETGTIYNANIFTLATPALATPVRSLTSRSYQYFFDGVRADTNKWDGSIASGGPANAPGGVSNWGIDAGDVTVTVAGGGTVATSFGPFGPGTMTDTPYGISSVPWTAINNMKVEDGVFSAVAVTDLGITLTESDQAFATNLGTGAVGASVVGIQVDVKLKVLSATDTAQANVQLVKNNLLYGSTKSLQINNTGLAFVTFGGKTDLWGGTWTISDVNSAQFGAMLQMFPGDILVTGTSHVSVDFIRVTVFVKPKTGSATDSGNGVGVVSSAAGAINLVVGRTYYLTFLNPITGQYSDISDASQSTGPATGLKFNLVLAVHNDPQVTKKVLLCTADGGDPSILYQLAELANSTTTFQDNTIETTMLLGQPLLFTDDFGNEFGCSLNDPPPLGNLACKHQGRLWMANGQNIFFSKAVAELTLPNGFIAGKYEECWPGSNYFDVSEGAETISALISDGTTLYFGTQSHVRRILGNDPTNFQEPQIVHPEVGIINQESVQIVFMEGAPGGAIWLTPDFRVVQSDFNNYIDIGHPIQDILNSINSQAPLLAHGTFVSDGEFDLFILAVPINSTTFCDTHLVYDMRRKMWFYWVPNDGSQTLLFNIAASGDPQWLFANNLNIFRYQSSASTDHGTAIPYSVTTSWLHLGEPSKRKLLDELEVTGDSKMLVSISGASTQTDFNAPISIVTNQALVTSPFGQLKIYLAGRSCKYRYYQFTFIPSSTTLEGLLGYNLKLIPFNSL